jgi:peptidyl-prolyl cis-trans isomerase SurA
MRKSICLWGACLLLLPLAARAQESGSIIEKVIARVNNDIITQSDLDHARKSLQEDTRQDCPACTPEQIRQKVASQEKDLLRDLIDNSLMVQRGKDLGINVDAEVVKRLDEIRQQNNIDSLDDLEKQVTQSGVDFEDFKNNIRNQLIVQEVIRREVGSKLILDHADVQKYYDEHKQDFVRPEQVALREIFVSTDGKPASQVAALRKKADALLERIKNGEDFGELAKHFSDGSTAKQGGDLGTFQRGQLAPNLEQIVFKLQGNQVTDVLPTKTGFLILQVLEHYVAGQQPEEKVENEIMDHLYNEKMKPALRAYLDMLRQDSYVEVKPGYVDTAGVSGDPIEEASPTADNSQKKKSGGHRFFPFGKKKNG